MRALKCSGDVSGPVHATFLVVCCSVFVFASDFCLFVSTQGIGVLRSLSPTSLSEHLSMGQARNPPTQGTTLSVIRALVPTLAVHPPHVCHRRETGQSP